MEVFQRLAGRSAQISSGNPLARFLRPTRATMRRADRGRLFQDRSRSLWLRGKRPVPATHRHGRARHANDRLRTGTTAGGRGWIAPARLNERIRRVGRTENVGVAPEECRRLYKISDSVFQPAEFRRASGRVMQCLHALSVTLISRFAIPPLGRSAILRYA